jgi:hypothetical protein
MNVLKLSMKQISILTLLFPFCANSFASGEEHFSQAQEVKDMTKPLTFEYFSLLDQAAQEGHEEARAELQHTAECINNVMNINAIWGGSEEENIQIRTLLAGYFTEE